MSRRSKDILLIAVIVIFALLLANALGLFSLIRGLAVTVIYVIAVVILAGVAVMVWQQARAGRRR